MFENTLLRCGGVHGPSWMCGLAITGCPFVAVPTRVAVVYGLDSWGRSPIAMVASTAPGVWGQRVASNGYFAQYCVLVMVEISF